MQASLLLDDAPAAGAAYGPLPARGARRAARAARAMDADGRPIDGRPVEPGDIFATLGDGTTTPYPKARGQRAASRWLIDNATAAARARGDDFNAPTFERTTLLRDGSLTTADRASLLMYLFDWQPAVASRLLSRC